MPFLWRGKIEGVKNFSTRLKAVNGPLALQKYSYEAIYIYSLNRIRGAAALLPDVGMLMSRRLTIVFIVSASCKRKFPAHPWPGQDS